MASERRSAGPAVSAPIVNAPNELFTQPRSDSVRAEDARRCDRYRSLRAIARNGRWPYKTAVLEPLGEPSCHSTLTVLRDATSPSRIGQFAVIQYAAPSVRLEVSPIDVREVSAIEPALAAFTR